MIRLYGPSLANGYIETQYGLITFCDWMNKEKERIEKNRERKAEIIIKGFTVSLWVNEVKGCKCTDCVNDERKVANGPSN